MKKQERERGIKNRGETQERMLELQPNNISIYTLNANGLKPVLRHCPTGIS